MFQSLDQLIEEAFIRAFPGKAQESKQVFRYELEAMVDAACTRLAEIVAKSNNYRWLQRSLVLPLNAARRPLTFPPSGQMHPTDGARTGLSIVEGSITPAAVNVYGIAAEVLTPDNTGNLAGCSIEWGVQSTTELLVLVRPTSKLDAIPFSMLDSQNALAVSVTSLGAVTVLQSGSSLGTDTLLAAQRVRLEFAADGTTKLTLLTATGVEVSSNTYSSDPVTEPCGIIFVFPNAGTVVVNPVIIRGVENVVDVPLDARLLLDTVPGIGQVNFEHPGEDWFAQPLSFLADDNYSMLPRIQGLWYWSYTTPSADGATGAAIRLYPGDRVSTAPATAIRVTGNIIPTWQDISHQLHEPLMELLVEIAQRRTLAGANVVQKVKK